MTAKTMERGMHHLGSKGLDALIGALGAEGYTVIGPTVQNGAIVYDEITGTSDLPSGVGDEQAPGYYRLTDEGRRGARFDYASSPQSWKKFLNPSRFRLWQANKGTNEAPPDLSVDEPEPQKLAFIGVRSCDLHAIATMDRVFLGGTHRDGYYEARRRDVFFVAVNCTQPSGTCFCTSMNTGPRATTGFDLALTELVEGGEPFYLVEEATQKGRDLLASLPVRSASADEAASAQRQCEETAAKMTKSLDTSGIKSLLYDNLEHPRWDDVAQRCLSCANCTLVCPTCFCSDVEDVTDVTGDHTERWRRWDSCFNEGFTYVHGGSVRKSTKSRYRQWLTHKLATWIDQFGTSGCVGCGRCIAWCPVGIDITKEVAAIRAEPKNSHGDEGN